MANHYATERWLRARLREHDAALPATRFSGPKFNTSVFGSGRERTSTK